MNWSCRFGFGFPPSDSKGKNPFIKLVWFMSSCASNCILPSTEHLVFIVIVIVVSIGWAHRIWKFWFQTRFRSLVVFAILCWSILIVTYVDLPPADKHCSLVCFFQVMSSCFQAWRSISAKFVEFFCRILGWCQKIKNFARNLDVCEL